MQFHDHLVEHYKRLYYFELDRKDKINSNVHLPMTIVALSIGAVSFFINNLPSLAANDNWPIIFFFFLSCSVVSIILSVYLIFKTYTGYSYEYVSSTADIDNYVNELQKFNREAGKKTRVDIQEKFLSLLLKQYCKCATTNSENNDKKAAYFRKSSISIMVAVVLIGITAFPFFATHYNSSPKVQRIEIVNFKEITMAKEKKDKDDSTKTKVSVRPASPSQKHEPVLPAEPKTKKVQESAKPKEIRFLSEEKK